MGWFKDLLFKQVDPSIRSSLDLFNMVYGGRQSSSGRSVNLNTAFELTIYLACCRVVAEGVSQIPFKLLQEVGRKRTDQSKTSLGTLVSISPNNLQTSFEFRETIMFHLLTGFNAYCFVPKVGIDREPKEIMPIDPSRMRVKKVDMNTVQYFVRGDSGEEVEFPAENIWHLKGPSWLPHLGMDALKMVRNALGLAMATEDVHAQLHKNGLQTSGVLGVEGKLTPERFAFLSTWLDKHSFSGDRYQKPLVIDQGGKWYNNMMNGVDAEHLATRKWQLEEICRAFRVMPLMLGHSDKTATYASSEQMFIAHVVHCLAPWYERIEQSANLFLLTEQQRKDGFYFKFMPDGLLRGDIAARYTAFQKALGAGGSPAWLTVNEVRAYQELDAIDGGDELPKPAAPPTAAQTKPPVNNQE